MLPLIQLSGLDIHRGNRLVISEIDFELFEGEVVALVGHNGCGKTTLLESSAGMHSISSGKFHWRCDNSEMKIIRDSEGRRNSLPPMGLTLQKNGMSGEETVEERLKTVLAVSGCELMIQSISTYSLLGVLNIVNLIGFLNFQGGWQDVLQFFQVWHLL